MPVNAPCKVSGCPTLMSKHSAKGYCKSHYMRFSRYGDPLIAPSKKYSLLDFYKYIEITDTCWNWTGPLDINGYGRSVRRLVHRVSYAITVEDLDPTLTIDHLCMNRRCLNPRHLEQVTQAVNNQRAIEARRRRKLMAASESRNT